MNMKTELTDSCIFCFKVSCMSTSNVISEDPLQLLKFLIPKINLLSLQDCLICEDCLRKMQEAYNFKNFYLENSTKRLNEQKIQEEIDSDTNYEELICQVCKCVLTISSCIPMVQIVNINHLSEMIKYLILKFELKMMQNFLFCYECKESLLKFSETMTLLSVYDHTEMHRSNVGANNLFECQRENEIDIKEEFNFSNINLIDSTLYKNNTLEIKQEIDEMLTQVPEEDNSEKIINEENIDLQEVKYTEVLENQLPSDKTLYEIKQYNCSECSFQTNKTGQLKKHSIIHGKTDKVKKFKCDFCDHQTKRKDSLKMHMLIHKDAREINWFKCSLCSYRGKKNAHLQQHLLVHKNPDEIEKYKCDICQNDFKAKNSLKRHMILHKSPEEIKWHGCTVCSFRSKRYDSVRLHMISHKKPEDIKMYNCHLCKFKTKVKYNLTKHMFVHKNPEEIQWFQCPHCSYRGKRKKYLINHMKTHNNFLFINVKEENYFDQST